MTVEEALKILEDNIAPVKLSDDFCARYKMYDNSGIIVNCGQAVSGVLFTLDLSVAAIVQAKSHGYNLIVTHHPAIYGGISAFDLTRDSHAQALAMCLNNGISVISMHLNFDVAPQGIDYHLMRGLGGGNEQVDILASVEGGGYGRCYSVPEKTFAQFVSEAKRTFATNRVTSYGRGEREIKTIASFCGAGCDDNAISFAKEKKADVFVSSDLKHHQIAELVDSGLYVIQLTHYCAETFGFKEIYLQIKQKLQVLSTFYADERFM